MNTIEVYAELGCPFAYAGLTMLRRRRDERGGGPTLVVRSWPLELVNDRPMKPDFVAHEIENLRAQVTPELFTGFSAEIFPATTLPAMALIAAAYELDPTVGEAVAFDLRDRLFEKGQVVDDDAVLDEVAAAHGVTRPDDVAAVVADYEEGRRRGVVGSPHFFLPDGDFFCPSLDIARVDGELQVRVDTENFEAFLDRCFA